MSIMIFKAPFPSTSKRASSMRFSMCTRTRQLSFLDYNQSFAVWYPFSWEESSLTEGLLFLCVCVCAFITENMSTLNKNFQIMTNPKTLVVSLWLFMALFSLSLRWSRRRMRRRKYALCAQQRSHYPAPWVPLICSHNTWKWPNT